MHSAFSWAWQRESCSGDHSIWLFFGSERGGKMGASPFSFIATCKALDVNPEAYLEDVITRVNTETAIQKHTPWAWAADNGTQLS